MITSLPSALFCVPRVPSSVCRRRFLWGGGPVFTPSWLPSIRSGCLAAAILRVKTAPPRGRLLHRLALQRCRRFGAGREPCHHRLRPYRVPEEHRGWHSLSSRLQRPRWPRPPTQSLPSPIHQMLRLRRVKARWLPSFCKCWRGPIWSRPRSRAFAANLKPTLGSASRR